MDEVSIVIPAYNEERRIMPTLRKIEIFMKEHPGVIGEVIVVDDGSKDRTVERCMYFMKRLPLRTQRLFDNGGKWRAIHHGLGIVRNDWVLLLDADDSADVDQILCVPHGWEIGRTAYFGSRFMEGASSDGKSGLRMIISEGYRAYVKMMYFLASGKTNVDDMQCPFKLFRRSCVLGVGDLEVSRWAGDIELACRLNTDIENVPVEFHHMRGSKVPMSAIVQMAWETGKVAIRERRSKYKTI